MHLLAKRLVFWGCWSGFSERGSQDLCNGTKVAFYFQLLLCLHKCHVYSPWSSICSRALTSPSFDSFHLVFSQQRSVWRRKRHSSPSSKPTWRIGKRSNRSRAWTNSGISWKKCWKYLTALIARRTPCGTQLSPRRCSALTIDWLIKSFVLERWTKKNTPENVYVGCLSQLVSKCFQVHFWAFIRSTLEPFHMSAQSSVL
jgi:hypothetical protein